jgi:S-adenosylmethionine decarboxylase
MLITQLLAEFYDCNSAIENQGSLADVAKRAAVAVGATVARECAVAYVPHGLTMAVFLAESHILMTTWPEFRLLLVDVLLCNPTMSPQQVLDLIKEEVCPQGTMVVHAVPRVVDSKS